MAHSVKQDLSIQFTIKECGSSVASSYKELRTNVVYIYVHVVQYGMRITVHVYIGLYQDVK